DTVIFCSDTCSLLDILLTLICHEPIHTSTPIFFYESRAHRNLHSFPTRRSSDLKSALIPLPVSLTVIWTSEFRRSSRTSTRPDRSEEHTSELQSRENLVCRLLLEKKKKIATTPSSR